MKLIVLEDALEGLAQRVGQPVVVQYHQVAAKIVWIVIAEAAAVAAVAVDVLVLQIGVVEAVLV